MEIKMSACNGCTFKLWLFFSINITGKIFDNVDVNLDLERLSKYIVNEI